MKQNKKERLAPNDNCANMKHNMIKILDKIYTMLKLQYAREIVMFPYKIT